MLGRKQQQQELEELQSRLSAAQRRVGELERELEARSLRDAVTGLPTMQAFARRVDTEVERARRYGRALTVAVLDVDGFRALNSRHGRDVGDEVLQAVARALTEHTRTSDVLTRANADEFIIAMPETGGDAALQAFERLLMELEALRVGPVECVSASVGIGEYERGMTTEQLVDAAADRMRAARAAGGGRAERELASPNGSAPANQPGVDAHNDAIAGLAEALTERDRYTGEHSESVVDLVANVARGLALDDSEVQRVRAAALLHDIGKVAIPDEILNKAGPLDDAEWERMREHPVIGERILRAIPGLGGVARIVRHEHERYDGGGYPDGLAGEDIPIGARIILACDAYHAMTSDRPYRKAMPHSEAIRELAKGAGTQFDPRVTEVLIGCLYGRRQAGAAAPAG